MTKEAKTNGAVDSWSPNRMLLTIVQASDALSISPGMIRKLVRTGKMKAVKIGRSVRFHRGELARIVNGGVQ
jgi:excisionase family DNA binding protein